MFVKDSNEWNSGSKNRFQQLNKILLEDQLCVVITVTKHFMTSILKYYKTLLRWKIQLFHYFIWLLDTLFSVAPPTHTPPAYLILMNTHCTQII